MATRFDLVGTNAIPYGNDQAVTFSPPSPVSIVGWGVEFDLRRRPGTAALLTKATPDDSGIALTDPANGVFTLTLSAADFATLQPGKYWYTVRRTDAGFMDLLAFGDCLVIPSQ